MIPCRLFDYTRHSRLQAGLKTGMYYLRTRAAADAIKFTVDQQVRAQRLRDKQCRSRGLQG